jgi:hypothetical protein
LSSGLEQLARELTQVGFGPPGGIALEGAFARHADPVDFTDATEKLEQRTIGQAGGELAIALVQELTGEVAAQSTTTVQLALLLSFGTDLLLALSPMFQIGLKELILTGTKVTADGVNNVSRTKSRCSNGDATR